MSVDIFRNMSKSGGFDLIITHIPTLKKVSFPGFITRFSDDISADFASEQVYGRMDPIVTYNGTGRNISATFDVIAESVEVAKENMQKFAIFSKMMYPKFAKVDESETLSLKAPPLLKIRFANLIKDSKSEDGLLGAARSAQFAPAVEMGFFAPTDEPGTLYAKKYTIDISFDVLHTQQVGWDEKNKWLGGDGWPHSVEGEPPGVTSPSASRLQDQTIVGATIESAVDSARTAIVSGEI